MVGCLFVTFEGGGGTSAETSQLVVNRTRVVSVKATNSHASVPKIFTLYDGTTTSDKALHKFYVPALTSLDWDFHGAICNNGLFLNVVQSSNHAAKDLTISVQII